MLISANKWLVNISVFFYFVFFLLTNQVNNYFVFCGFYLSLVMCCVVGVYTSNARLIIKVFAITVVFLITGVINLLAVGNTSIKELVYIILFAFSSLSLVSDELDERVILLVLVLNILVVSFKIISVGIYGGIYTNASRNFVSVYLMYPLVVYYSIEAKKKVKINIIPVILVWTISLVARGRGGIISTTIFLVGVSIVVFLRMRSDKRIIISWMVILCSIVMLTNSKLFIERLKVASVMEFFVQNGMRSSRTMFWQEYLVLAKTNFKNFWLGFNIDNTYIGTNLGGNPHNSFIEIHMLNGMISLIFTVLILFKNTILSLLTKNYLFLVCLVAITVRAFTDHVLWAAFGTPVFFYILLYYDSIKLVNKKPKFYCP